MCLAAREYAVRLSLAQLVPSEFNIEQKTVAASVKDVWKWINGPALATLLGVAFDQKSSFEILLTFAYDDDLDECRFLSKLYPDIFRRRKKNKNTLGVFNRSNVSRAIESTKPEVFRQYFQCPPTRPSSFATVVPISCQHAAVYIAGR